MNDFIKNIMGQFTIESMLNDKESFSMSDYELKLADDWNIANFKNLGGTYALFSKQFILADIVEPDSPAGMASAAIKDNISKGIETQSFINNEVMKHLISLKDLSIISSHIAMLTAHSIMKDVEDINHIPKDLMRKYLMPDSVAIPMGFYVATVCVGNPHFNVDSFNRIFAHSWHNYYETAMAKLFMFRMSGNQWKSQFSGCLLDY